MACPICTPTTGAGEFEYPTVGTLCDDHWRAKLAEGLTPDDWATLNRMAARDYRPWNKPTTYGKLPPPPKPRQLTRVKHLEQIKKAMVLPKGSQDTHRVQSIVGRPYPDGGYVSATNGHMALIEAGPGEGAPTVELYPKASRMMELPADFELVLRRARPCVNERNTALTFTIERGGLLVEAKSSDYYHGAQSSEFFPCRTPPELFADTLFDDRAPIQVCLSADYLLALCGRWPLRWHLATGQKITPGYRGGPERTDHLATITASRFTFGTEDYTVLLMPMRA